MTTQSKQTWRDFTPEKRKCQRCNKLFLVGGRGNARKAAKLCSKTCGTVETRLRLKARKMTVAERAYLAGIIDGEGCIVATRHKRPTASWRLQVVNTDMGLLEWCIEVTGVGSITTHTHDTNFKRNFTVYTWACYSAKAASVLRQIIPYMIIKRAKAEIALHQINLQQAQIAAKKRDVPFINHWLKRGYKKVEIAKAFEMSPSMMSLYAKGEVPEYLR